MVKAMATNASIAFHPPVHTAKAGIDWSVKQHVERMMTMKVAKRRFLPVAVSDGR